MIMGMRSCRSCGTGLHAVVATTVVQIQAPHVDPQAHVVVAQSQVRTKAKKFISGHGHETLEFCSVVFFKKKKYQLIKYKYTGIPHHIFWIANLFFFVIELLGLTFILVLSVYPFS